MLERLADYERKLRLLRQIMSNKARRYSTINATADIGTVIVSSFLTFIGFAGISKIHGYINAFAAVSESTIELLFNFLVFSLFVLVILHLVFRFAARQSEAERAIVLLTHLINQVEDILAKAEHGYSVSASDVDLVREKYDSLLQIIPANSDREYLRAKKDYHEKEERKKALRLGAREIFDAEAQRRMILALVRESPSIMQILDSLRSIDARLYLGGGLIRNAVWDYLHGYSSATPIDDVDVIYFDKLSATKDHDEALEAKLRAAFPNLKWSVKNQARMHKSNGEEPYSSLEDAVKKWPETATAMAARLATDGNIEFIATYGYDDLFRLIVAPTEHFRTRLERYQERLSHKNWAVQWPRLRFVDQIPNSPNAAVKG
jgi:hypothetical protein